ncbi:MAG: hypothetical protein Ta2G_08900 [Termitinemataceae bacterium]|nr:MAG: hypothetical protein Ta2G_08900 [Termitinemataceae bacterium]
MMNKTRLYFALTLFVLHLGNLFAGAPELKNVMPNSWQRLVRLTDNEEKEFLKINKKIIEDQKNLIKKTEQSLSEQSLKENSSIFKPDYIRTGRVFTIKKFAIINGYAQNY